MLPLLYGGERWGDTTVCLSQDGASSYPMDYVRFRKREVMCEERGGCANLSAITRRCFDKNALMYSPMHWRI